MNGGKDLFDERRTNQSFLRLSVRSVRSRLILFYLFPLDIGETPYSGSSATARQKSSDNEHERDNENDEWNSVGQHGLSRLTLRTYTPRRGNLG